MMDTTERTEIIDHAPLRSGFGTSRTWSRKINGIHYSFTAVLMPSGERRYFASKLVGIDPRFDCNWHRCFAAIFPMTSPTCNTGDDLLTVIAELPIAERELALSTYSLRLLRDAADLCGVGDADMLTRRQAIAAIIENF